ncbi:S-layer homology domain-containing protein [Paenibacillus oenotherae]|uniref:S-layer homology domain-containing protein n=1 Tax=Paenibacillus oenotherae TaxID=1435645 RepID=A0ABS7D4Z0_9BACL|nr:S-layer homology domain-containing protein [Paenibacillus oenotherae]MBW7475012.1 S-layer homology domain-containing protein [Paenibacillus oenotherae]
MRNTSDPYFKQNSQEPKHFRGGEKKVMKKSLSLLVAIAMVISMFASVAAAAEPELTTQQKFDALKEAGIFSGYPPNGDAGLNREMTRAEFAKVIALINGLEDNATAAAQYTDIPAKYWAAPFIGAVTVEGIMNGLGAGKFGPTGKVTIEQVAKIVVEIAGLEPKEGATVPGTSAWAAGYVAAAVEAGLIPQQASYKGNALRGLLVDVAFDVAGEVEGAISVKSVKVVDEKNIEVTFSDNEVVKKALDTALVAGTATKVSVEYKGKTYEVEVKLDAIKATAAKQTGAKKITVDFNQPALAADKTALTYELKSSFTTYSVTPKYADDNKSVVLEAAYLAAGDYTLTVKGSEAISLKVETEKAAKVDITVPAVQKADGVSLGAKLLNQFGEEMAQKPEVTVYNTTKNKTVAVNNGKVDLKSDDVAAINDILNVVAVYPSAGLSNSKQLKVINGSIATSVKLTEVLPLTGKTRISINEDGFVLPLVLTDANGQVVKLPESANINPGNVQSFDYAGLYFYISDLKLIPKFTINSDGVIKFDTKSDNGKGGTVTIYVTNPAANASATINVPVSGKAEVKELQVSHPGKQIVKGEKVIFPYVAIDSFGAKIEPKDFNLDKVSFIGTNVTSKVTAKGELELVFANDGSFTLYTLVNGVQQKDSLQVTVGNHAKTTAINGLKDVTTTLEVGAAVEVKKGNIQIIDSYGRVKDVADNTYSVVSKKPAVIAYNAGTGKLEAIADGSADVTVTWTGTDADGEQRTFSKDFAFTVVKSDDIKSYEIKSIGTVYGKSDLSNNDKAKYSKTVKVNGKTAGGTLVALVNDVAPFVTSSEPTILSTDGAAIFGKKAGKSTVSVVINGKTVATQEVTVAEEAPALKTAKFKKDEYTTTVNGQVTVELELKDQYDVEIAPGFQTSTVNKDVATFASATSLVVTGHKVGSTTLTYVASNGVTATATIVVE